MAEPGDAIVLLTTEPTAQGIVVVSRIYALRAAEVTAEVRVERIAAAGQVRVAQSRTLSLAAGETGDIARSQISFGPGDVLDVFATVTAGGEVIARSRLTIAADSPQPGEPI